MKHFLSTHRGLLDFLVQRLSAVVIGIYVIHLVVVISLNGGLTFQSWERYFSSPYAKILFSVTLLSILLHSWVGMWTIGTDYLRQRKPGSTMNVVRNVYNSLIGIALVAYFILMLMVVWG